MRLQRFLAQAGVASRRKAETLITDGRVKVNGRVVTELGTQVDPRHDEVVVGGRRVAAEAHVYLLLNKPRGYVTTRSDPEGRPTVMELCRGVEERVYPVGRLDFNTEGVLILTNDGDLANGLMHPRGEVQKTYRVKLRGLAGPEVVEGFRRGVVLDDGSRTAPAEVTLLGPSEGGHNSWLEVTIHEGKNRQIHRMSEALGLTVAKLVRVRYAGLEAGTLRPGRWRRLSEGEVDGLRRAAGLQRKVERRPSAVDRSSRGGGARSQRPRKR
jgi:23S rRNA pseudouridine2605 synthase